jgi:hypothetical protein
MRLKAYAIVILQNWSLQDKIASLPTSEVFPSFRQVPLLMAGLHDWLLGFTHYIRGEESDHLIVVFHGQIDERLEIVLEYGLRGSKIERKSHEKLGE